MTAPAPTSSAAAAEPGATTEPGTRPLRVLHIITRLIVGGAQENTLLSADLHSHDPAWAGRYQVEIISGEQTGPEGSLIDDANARGITLRLLPQLRRELDPVQDLAALFQLRRLIRRGRYDIVHTHSSKAGLLGRLAARCSGVPVIVHTVHGWSFHDRLPAWRRRLYIIMERLAHRCGQAAIVVTSRDIDKGLAAGIGRREDYHVIRSGIELADFRHPARTAAAVRNELGIPPETLLVGSVTRLSEQKAPLDLIDAFVRVAGQRPNVRFLLVGDGPLRPSVTQAITASGLSDRIHLLGLRRDIPDLLAAMDILVLSSLWEGLPRVIPQAMAAGVAVVSTAVDGSAEIISDGHNGLLAAPGQPEQLAGAVIRLLDDPRLHRRLVEQAGQQLDEFCARRMAQAIDQLYRQLLAIGR